MIHENLGTKKLPSERVELYGIVDLNTLKYHAIIRNRLYFRTDFKQNKRILNCVNGHPNLPLVSLVVDLSTTNLIWPKGPYLWLGLDSSQRKFEILERTHRHQDRH